MKSLAGAKAQPCQVTIGVQGAHHPQSRQQEGEQKTAAVVVVGGPHGHDKDQQGKDQAITRRQDIDPLPREDDRPVAGGRTALDLQ